MPVRSHHNLWLREIKDLIRGISGGFLFGIPLLYTMEVWWVGSAAEPLRLLSAIALTFTIIVLLNQTSGFRGTADVRFSDACMDSTEEIALGILCSTCILVLLREITLDTSLKEALGKLIYESIPFALGVALANQLLGGQQDEAQSQSNPQPQRKNRLNSTLADLGAAFIGAIVVAFSIAPTDEVPMLATAVSGPWLLALIAASLLISYTIVFAADFSNQKNVINNRESFKILLVKQLSLTLSPFLLLCLCCCYLIS